MLDYGRNPLRNKQRIISMQMMNMMMIVTEARKKRIIVVIYVFHLMKNNPKPKNPDEESHSFEKQKYNNKRR